MSPTNRRTTSSTPGPCRSTVARRFACGRSSPWPARGSCTPRPRPDQSRQREGRLLRQLLRSRLLRAVERPCRRHRRDRAADGRRPPATDVIRPRIQPRQHSRPLSRATCRTTSSTELYSVPSAGGSAVKLNGVLTPGGNVWSYEFSPDSTRVVYLADQQTVGKRRALQRAARRRRGDEAQRCAASPGGVVRVPRSAPTARASSTCADRGYRRGLRALSACRSPAAR